MSFYDSLLAKKRTWSPVRPTAAPVVEGAEDVIARALSLRVLEIPVGDFIKDATKKEIPAGSLALLESNIVDEERHDEALRLVAESMEGLIPNYDAEAAKICKAWIDAPEHPVLKALVLERSVFFVILPIFRFLGNTGLRTTSADISRDEITHVSCNSAFCNEMGISLTPNLDKMRKATIAWMTQELNIPNHQYGSKDFWRRQSDKLLYEGKAPELNESRRSRVPAFFEIDNRNLPAYA